jgi:serine/threonine protein phosphatase PrpC
MEPISSFEVEDSGSEPGTVYNDDCWGSVAGAVWILDGATGLSKKRLLPSASSDAQWFVRAVDQELRNADWSAATEILLRSAMQQVYRKFCDESRGSSEQALWPFSSFALVRVLGSSIEFVNLGDCRILWTSSDAKAVKSFGWSRVTELDGNVVQEINRLHREGTTDNEVVWQTISPIIQANRALKNQPGGYWILDVAGEGLGHLQRMELRPSEVDRVLLCTDGYYRLVDTYRTRSEETLLKDSMELGIAGTIRSIREIELADDRCLSFPRIKPSDDATAVLAVVKHSQ